MNNSQEVMKNIKAIVKEQGKTVGKMLEDCKLSKNALSSMQSGYLPRTENLCKIADYLGVSVDYLLGRDSDIKKAPAETGVDIDLSKKSKSQWISEIGVLSDDNATRLREYFELLLLKQARDSQVNK